MARSGEIGGRRLAQVIEYVDHVSTWQGAVLHWLASADQQPPKQQAHPRVKGRRTAMWPSVAAKEFLLGRLVFAQAAVEYGE